MAQQNDSSILDRAWCTLQYQAVEPNVIGVAYPDCLSYMLLQSEGCTAVEDHLLHGLPEPRPQESSRRSAAQLDSPSALSSSSLGPRNHANPAP